MCMINEAEHQQLQQELTSSKADLDRMRQLCSEAQQAACSARSEVDGLKWALEVARNDSEYLRRKKAPPNLVVTHSYNFSM